MRMTVARSGEEVDGGPDEECEERVAYKQGFVDGDEGYTVDIDFQDAFRAYRAVKLCVIRRTWPEMGDRRR